MEILNLFLIDFRVQSGDSIRDRRSCVIKYREMVSAERPQSAEADCQRGRPTTRKAAGDEGEAGAGASQRDVRNTPSALGQLCQSDGPRLTRTDEADDLVRKCHYQVGNIARTPLFMPFVHASVGPSVCRLWGRCSGELPCSVAVDGR